MFSLCVLKLVHQALKTIAKSVVKTRISDSLYFPMIFDQTCRSWGGDHIYIYIYIYIYTYILQITANPKLAVTMQHKQMLIDKFCVNVRTPRCVTVLLSLSVSVLSSSSSYYSFQFCCYYIFIIIIIIILLLFIIIIILVIIVIITTITMPHRMGKRSRRAARPGALLAKPRIIWYNVIHYTMTYCSILYHTTTWNHLI